MDSIILIGYIASFFCSITFVPQAITLRVYIVTDKIWEIYTLSVI